MKTENKSAFPMYIPDDHQHSAEGLKDHGLTKREYFAAMAMQGIIMNDNFVKSTPEKAAINAIAYADEILKHLESNPLKN